MYHLQLQMQRCAISTLFSKLSTILFCCFGCFPRIYELADATDQSGGVAVGPALAKITAMLKNLDNKFWNSKTAASSVLQTMVKATAGHPAGVPADATLVALGPAPVPVGIALPPEAILAGLPWTRGRLASLTAAQLNDLEWFYNELFVGQTVDDRRIVFSAFMGV
jgi:hypothetical protein